MAITHDVPPESSPLRELAHAIDQALTVERGCKAQGRTLTFREMSGAVRYSAACREAVNGVGAAQDR
jgi:hypothetical protein